MSQLTPKKFSERQIEYSENIEKMLDGWGALIGVVIGNFVSTCFLASKVGRHEQQLKPQKDNNADQ